MTTEMLKKDSFKDPGSHNVKVLLIFPYEINTGGDCFNNVIKQSRLNADLLLTHYNR